MSLRSRLSRRLALFYGVVVAVLSIAGCGGGKPASVTRYDAAAGKLCLTLASQIRSVTNHTTFAYDVPPVPEKLPKTRRALIHEVDAVIDRERRKHFIEGARAEAATVESVASELHAIPVSSAEQSAKRTFESELSRSAAAYRAFATRLANLPTPPSTSYVRDYAVPTVDALRGCKARVRAYEAAELAHKQS